ncbi:MAG: hypothetical protein KME25_23780 [Symplocastrum torsivum CPER-KK1]|uniref:Uncharacterized protein n=1 Tax=Symplocastrum torsivum CPER-KK1 TaxID=450513 RepID=A0A951PRD6_9CYAN|nr:hypothetical protein [Symplocastrum torsivum CPER-KK1]
MNDQEKKRGAFKGTTLTDASTQEIATQKEVAEVLLKELEKTNLDEDDDDS